MGVIFAVAGALLMALGFFQSGAASYSDTLNIGLLNDKTNLIAIGGYLFVGGIILHAKDAIIDVVSPGKKAGTWSAEDEIGNSEKSDDGAVV